ncbi:MAG: hypothetical protein GX595_09880 [Lentisphaerae bacterium]|nr:hypothetical protein [Lentisphaerota bacterium]
MPRLIPRVSGRLRWRLRLRCAVAPSWRRLIAGVILFGLAAGVPAANLLVGPSIGTDSPVPVKADYVLRVLPRPESRDTFEVPRAGPATILLRGLARGGAVEISVNGSAPAAVELLASGGLPMGRADCALVTAPLNLGRNDITVLEADGAQVVRVPGTQTWFATSTLSGGMPVFSVDTRHLIVPHREYPVAVNFGPRWREFFWFSGRWDYYCGAVYGDRIAQVRGSSGRDQAALSYTLEDTQRRLVTPIQIALIPDSATGTCHLRVRQALRAVGEPTLLENMQFLHIKLDGQGARDWRDGNTDYVWYRTPPAGSPDALPGSRTGMVRVDDNSFRVYRWPSSTADRRQTALSDIHHTAAATALDGTRALGGFLTKTGVGSVGWIFHRYKATFRDDLAPIFSHCGDGADTHFYLYATGLFSPLNLRAGDRVDVDYTLSLLPCEVTREDIEDLNEADLHLFGDVSQQRSSIAGWVGNRQAVGLRRDDGSLLLLGIGRENGVFPVPAADLARARMAYRVFDLPSPTYEMVALDRQGLEVRPGWFTVVDCGSALFAPRETLLQPIGPPPETTWDLPQAPAATAEPDTAPAAPAPAPAPTPPPAGRPDAAMPG